MSLVELPGKLLLMFIVVTFLVSLLPGFVEILDTGRQSDSLNCVGFVYDGDTGHTLSYNATIGTKSTIGCLALSLYLPYIILGVLVAVVGMVIYSRYQQDQFGG